MISQCPGSKQFRQPEPEILICPSCKYEVEIWTDEVKATCHSCKKIVFRGNEQQSCLDWCAHAKECVGQSIYETYMAHIKERIHP